jgi:hypothetical protein
MRDDFSVGFLKDLFGGAAPVDSTRLGSEGDAIQQMLFASQSLEEQVQRMRLDGRPGPHRSIADAHELAVAGNKMEAIALLRGVLEMPSLETRTLLWCGRVCGNCGRNRNRSLRLRSWVWSSRCRRVGRTTRWRRTWMVGAILKLFGEGDFLGCGGSGD